MAKNNLERMIQLAGEFFQAHNDPDQISVDENIMQRLRDIHPATITQEEDENGPIAWILIIPTTDRVMKEFIAGTINENELLELTRKDSIFTALYLCSALVLPEYRGKGIARRLTVAAIKSIQEQHPLKALFYWSFSPEGERLAQSIAKETGLQLLKRD
ncbi:MAG: GNAT family N-acetyltransferase [Bacteroidota bacterium]